MSSRRIRSFVLCVGFLLCAAVGAAAQDRAGEFSLQTSEGAGAPPFAAGFASTRWQLDAGYQFNEINIRGAFAPFSTSGVNASITRYFSRVLGIEGEAGIGFGAAAPGAGTWSIFVGVGPHFALRTNRRFEPWVHGLLGVEHFSFGKLPFPLTTTAWIAGGGLDYRFHSGWVWRAEADYLGMHFGNAYQRNLQIVGGVVWNF